MEINWLEQRLGHQCGNHAYSGVYIFILLLHKKVGTLLAIAISIQPRFFTWTILEEMILILHWWVISVLACIASSDRWARLLSIFVLSQHSSPTNEYRPNFPVGINKGDSCWISSGPWYSTCKMVTVCACFYSNHLTPSIQFWRCTGYDHFWPCCLSKHKNTSKQSQKIQIYRSDVNKAWTCAERLSEKYKVTSPAPASISTWLQNGIKRAVKTNLVVQSNPSCYQWWLPTSPLAEIFTCNYWVIFEFNCTAPLVLTNLPKFTKDLPSWASNSDKLQTWIGRKMQDCLLEIQGGQIPDARYLTIILLFKTETIHIDECEHLPLVHAHVSATLLNPLLWQFLHYWRIKQSQ